MSERLIPSEVNWLLRFKAKQGMGGCIVEGQEVQAVIDELNRLEQQLALAQLENQKLREALEAANEKLKLHLSGFREYRGGMQTQELFPLIQAALSTPLDTYALDEYVKQRLEVAGKVINTHHIYGASLYGGLHDNDKILYVLKD